MSDQISTGDNPSATVTDNPAGPVPSQGTAPASGQATAAAPTDELFKGIDPNQLPPEIRKHYDSMLRDYREKTTKLSEERKKYDGFDAYKQKAEWYDRFASQEDAVKWWNEYVQKVNGEGGQADPNDPNAKLQAEIQEIKSELQSAKMAEIIDAFASAKNEKGELMNSDFDALHGIVIGNHEKLGPYSLLRFATDLASGETPQERLANGYKAAKAVRDAILEEGRKQGMGKMLARVRGSTEAPTPVSSDKSVFNGDPKTLTAKQARELAQKGVSVR